MTADMFATLDQVTRLVEEEKPDEAYRVMKDAVTEDSHGFARIFLTEWMKHLEGEDEAVQNKFAEIVIFLKDDFPTTVPTATPEPVQSLFMEPTVDALTRELPEPAPTPDVISEPAATKQLASQPTKKSKPARGVRRSPSVDETGQISLTFYDWQMTAIERAAKKREIGENALISEILESGNAEPLSWARYRHSQASPSHRITVTLPCQTKDSLDHDRDAQGIKTTTKYVRKILFGARAEKY